jgi:hypothetical protein
MKIETMIEGLLNALLPRHMSPKLAVVNKVYTEEGTGKYSADVEILRTGDRGRSGKVISEVPISPVWGGKHKQGLYCTLEKDTLVIIDFIDWDSSFPYIAGVYSDQYETVSHPAGSCILTDGEGTVLEMADKTITLKSGDSSTVTLTDSSFNIGGDEATQPIPKGNILKAELEKDKNAMRVLQAALTAWTPVPEDGGAALKSALVGFLAMQMADYENINSEYGKVK